MFSSDEDDQTVDSVVTNSRITYAIAMNNRMVQEGCSSSGSGNSGSSGSVVTNAVSEPSATEEEATVARYPKRVRQLAPGFHAS
jgi:hypothetical protein